MTLTPGKAKLVQGWSQPFGDRHQIRLSTAFPRQPAGSAEGVGAVTYAPAPSYDDLGRCRMSGERTGETAMVKTTRGEAAQGSFSPFPN